MGLFSKKSAAAVCPLCQEEFDSGIVKPLHFLAHVTDTGDGGYMYACTICGDQDGTWSENYQAAIGMSVHMQDRHRVKVM